MSKLTGEVLDILRARERKYDQLVVEVTLFRAFLDQHDGFGPAWQAGTYNVIPVQQQTAAAYAAVSRASRQVGGKGIEREVERLERTREPVFDAIRNHAIVAWPERTTASAIVDDLVAEVSRASRRFRATRAILLGTFVLGAAVGVVLTLLVQLAR